MRLLFGLLLFSLWASFARYYYVCTIKHMCEPIEIVEATPERLQNLSLQFGDENILEGYNQLYFKEGDSNPILDSNNIVFLDELATYLLENDDKKLTIIGKFLASEADITHEDSDNLGIARAKAVRELLLTRIPDLADRIFVSHAEVEGDTLTEPVEFIIKNIADTELTDLQFTFYDQTFTEANFEFNSSEFIPKESFLFYADSLKTFLELNPDKSLTIYGHTDKVGTKKYNKRLGYLRAEQAKLHLIEKSGIESEIKIESKGETEAVTKDPKKAGLNRRVQFIIE